MSKEFVYKFDGKNIKGTIVPISILKSLVTELDSLNSNIYQSKYQKKGNVDFEIELKKGSTEFAIYSPEDDPKGLSILKGHENLWKSVGSNNFEGDLIKKNKIRNNVKKILNKVNGWADTLELVSDSQISTKFEINDKFIEKIPDENIIEEDEHVCYIYGMNARTHKIHFKLFNGTKISSYINSRFENRIKTQYKDFVYIKLEKRPYTNHYNLVKFIPIIREAKSLESFNDTELNSVKDKIDTFKNLSQGWDGYNAEPLKEELIKNTYKYLSRFYEFTKDVELPKVLPEVAPTPNGTIQFEWDYKDKHLEIEIDNKGLILVLQEENDIILSEFNLASFEYALDLVRWVLS